MSEATEQMALFQFLATVEGRYPLLAYVFHVPNGEKRAIATAKRLKAMGVKPGVPDIIAPFKNQAPIHPFRAGDLPGLVIEMKTARGRLSTAQKRWRNHFRAQGWGYITCRDWTEAARLLVTWAGGEPGEVGL